MPSSPASVSVSGSETRASGGDYHKNACEKRRYAMNNVQLKDKDMVLHKNIRQLPFICFLAAIGDMLRGRIHFSQKYRGKAIRMDDGQQFTVFRHMVFDKSANHSETIPTVFIVRFTFAALSQQANRTASLIPIPLIAGFPGFREKIWMVNEQTGSWQGVYQWESEQAADAYQHSFVLSIMNKRAIPESLSYTILPKTRLSEYMRTHVITGETS
jgi:hypothetical protein